MILPLSMTIRPSVMDFQRYSKDEVTTVRTASDGFSALALLRDRTPRNSPSDLDMPGMSGFELLSVVRRRFPAISVIAMSGAYSGVFVPPGVAADAFYAKGSNSVARLFEILWSIEDTDSRESLRAAVSTIWIPACQLMNMTGPAVAVSCPECLRSFIRLVGRSQGLDSPDILPPLLLSLPTGFR